MQVVRQCLREASFSADASYVFLPYACTAQASDTCAVELRCAQHKRLILVVELSGPEAAFRCQRGEGGLSHNWARMFRTSTLIRS